MIFDDDEDDNTFQYPGSGGTAPDHDDGGPTFECHRSPTPHGECVLLDVPSGRQTPIDPDIAHKCYGSSTYHTDGGRVCVHVTQDGELPGGDW